MPIILSNLIKQLKSQLRGMSNSRLAVLIVSSMALVIIGTSVYSILEGWSVLDALYATVITMTTVGYGDLSPQTRGGRTFAIFFTLAAIGLASYAISELAAYVIEQQLSKHERRLQERRMQRIQDLSNHVIICGGGIVGHRTANEFIRNGTPFILIEPDEDVLRWALLWLHEGYVSKRMAIWQHLEDVEVASDEEKGVAELADEVNIPYLMEDPTQETAMRHAGIERARGIITTMNDDRDNMSIILSARDMADRLGNPNLRIITRVVNEWNIRRLSLAGADKVISPNMRGGYILASQMTDPVLTEFWDQMMFDDESMVRFTDLSVADRPELAGKNLVELREGFGQMVLAIKRNGTFIYAPELDTVLESTDSVIVLGQA